MFCEWAVTSQNTLVPGTFRALVRPECCPPAEQVTKDPAEDPFGLVQGINNNFFSTKEFQKQNKGIL